VTFCQFAASSYPHMLTNFGQCKLIFNKMALLVLGVLFVFTVSSFWVSASQIVLTLSLMMSGANSPDLNPLDYQVWGQCWSLHTSCNRSQKRFPGLKNAL